MIVFPAKMYEVSVSTVYLLGSRSHIIHYLRMSPVKPDFVASEEMLQSQNVPDSLPHSVPLDLDS